jgi:hypothetical protein
MQKKGPEKEALWKLCGADPALPQLTRASTLPPVYDFTIFPDFWLAFARPPEETAAKHGAIEVVSWRAVNRVPW